MITKRSLWLLVNGKWFKDRLFKRQFQSRKQENRELSLAINHQPSTINPKGFTLLETLIATGIAAVIITSALSIVASIYFSQKRIQFSQDFFAEARFLMERIAQITRNNTIDFDRYFVEYGPPGTCSGFNADQLPAGYVNTTNDRDNRNTLGYSTIFYWDTNGDDTQDRNLGGVNPTGNTVDPCTQAWDNTSVLSVLYLINSSRTLRTEVRHLTGGSDLKVALVRQLAADTDGDGEANVWGPYDNDGDGVYEAADGDIELRWSGSECQIIYDENGDNTYADPTEYFPVMGDSTSEEWCDQAHVQEDISPVALQVNQLQFEPNPVYDPYLAFRNNGAQVHPQVFINMDLELRNPDRYGFEVGSEPVINFQTAVSSRVFGDIRR